MVFLRLSRLHTWSVAVFVFVLANCSYATEGKDPRFAAISKAELKKQIQSTPISSAKHALLTARADTSSLEELAYEQYTNQWKKFPGSSYANLRRGIAALNYWRAYALRKKDTNTLFPKQKQELFETTRSCLAKAVELDSASASANVAYGFFLWQYDNQMDKGLALLKKAAKLSPNEARVHANLGAVYSNQSGNAYDLRKAEQELRTAIRLDRTWGYPYALLASVYLQMENFKDAQWAVDAYSKLGNPENVKIYQDAIKREMDKPR